jgi:hypothetical protein
MYNKKLSEIFNGRHDDDGYAWPFHANDKLTTRKKIFYAIGDSWLDRDFFNRVFHNQYPEYFLINRSMCAVSNSVMNNMLKEDVVFLKNLDVDVIFMVALSEVGRSKLDLKLVDPKHFSNTHEYFGEILKKQYQSIQEIINGYSNFITTAYITNNFNENKSIIDFCGHSKLIKPKNVFSVYSNGIFEFLKDRGKIFQFNFADDLGKAIELKNFLLSHDNIDEKIHPDRYKPYEDFLENVFLNLQKT